MATWTLIDRIAVLLAIVAFVIGLALQAPTVVLGAVFWLIVGVGYLLERWQRGRE